MSHLRLVQSYDESTHPYSYELHLSDGHDAIEFENARRRLSNVATYIGAKDFFIRNGRDVVTLYLKDPNEFEKVSLALAPEDPEDSTIIEQFATFSEGTDNRRIKRIGHAVMKPHKGSEIGKKISFKVDGNTKALLIIAQDKDSYLKFRSFHDGTLEPVVEGP